MWLSLFTVIYLSNCRPEHKMEIRHHEEELRMLKKEISEDLTRNLLNYWATKMIDTLNGGFYGRVDAQETVYPESEKGGILNARILWTFSSAYRVLKDSSYLHLATYAKDYIMEHFIDPEYGGAYMTVSYRGDPLDTRKHTLTLSYFIYAFAEYYRATGEERALEEAIKIFKAIEEYALDREFNGYFEVFSRDWTRVNDRLLGERSPEDEKTMITHLHLVEAYAGLFRVWKEERMKDRLRNILETFNEKIIDDKTYHLHYFMDRNWNPTTKIDSYGHDIEASWLIYEAAHILHDPTYLAQVTELSVKVADAAAEGIMADGSMLTEKDHETDHVVKIRSWWEQAESVVGYLNAYEITGDMKYLDMAIKSWEYIKQYIIDNENGGWYPFVNEDGIPGTRDKANFWTCPYHNGRMALEVIERID